MSEFQFLRPLWLLALLPLGLLLWLRRRNPNDPSASGAWSRVVDAHLLRHLLVPSPVRAKRRTRAWPVIGWLLAVVALAGPAWERVPPLRFEPQVPPLVLVIDLSRSMDVRDQAPTRLQVAKAKLRALLDELSPRPVGLVVFAASAHGVMPLTRDVRLIASSLDPLETGLMPAQGSDVARALDHAGRMLHQARVRNGHVLLVTDGPGQGALEAAGRLRETGIRLSVLGLGRDEGGPVPDADDGYITGDNGPLQSAPDVGGMKRLADRGGGGFVRARQDDGDVQALVPLLGDASAVGDAMGEGRGEVWRDRGPWLILLLIPLALLHFRQAGPWVVAALVLARPLPAEAVDWRALWLSPDQQGLAALQHGDLAEARNAFRDPVWLGVTHWHLGETEEALASFGRADSALAHYNRGVVLVHIGRLGEALGAFESALRREPGMDAARRNLELLQAALSGDAELSDSDDLSRTDEKDRAPVPRNQPVPTTSEQEFLEGARPEDLFQPMGEAPPDLDRIGTVGSGAMLIRGGAHPDMKETFAAGQGAGGEGAMEADPRDTAEGNAAGGEAETAGGRASVPGNGQHTKTGGSDGDSQGGDDAGAGDDGMAQGLSKEGEGQAQVDEESGEAAAQAGAGGGLASLDVQSLEQWLDRIPDQPAGLLKQKFLREYQRGAPVAGGLDPW